MENVVEIMLYNGSEIVVQTEWRFARVVVENGREWQAACVEDGVP